jgi:hypothetical protein
MIIIKNAHTCIYIYILNTHLFWELVFNICIYIYIYARVYVRVLNNYHIFPNKQHIYSNHSISKPINLN